MRDVPGDQDPAVNHLWGDDWPAVRALWRLDDSVRHLNHGSYGAVPVAVRAAQARVHEEIDANPDAFWRRHLDERLDGVRARVAGFIEADVGGVALVRNVTEGVSQVLGSFPLSSGDELLVTDHAYPAVRLAAERCAQRKSATLMTAELGLTADDGLLVDDLMSAVSRRTRLAIIDAIASPSGRVFPVRPIIDALHRQGVAVLIDGAHEPGMAPMDVEVSGADFWVGNFHKWTCAPHGTAALWVAARWREHMRPLVAALNLESGYPHNMTRLGTDDLTPHLCVPIALDLLGILGWDRLHRHNATLAAHGARAIAEALGTRPIAGRFHCRVPAALPDGIGVTPDEALRLQTRIALELRTEVPVAPASFRSRHGFVLVSAHAYNRPSEYELFGQELSRWLRSEV